MNSISGVYEIRNVINGKRYIGSSIDIKKRKREHLCLLRNKKHHSPHLQNSFCKYGKENFIFCVLEECPVSILIQREQHYIDTLHPEYNIAPYAKNKLGTKRTQESKDRMSKIMLGKKNGLGNKSRTGQKRSVEERAKTSLALKGKKKSEEWIRKMKIIWTAKKNAHRK
ncbi:MAG: GIY-YIG nuclease family protein [Candidatus Obscuribacterales bacterium]|jgi:group I intron endonuclease